MANCDDFNTTFIFPAEFPYEFDSFCSSSDRGSAETEGSDEDDLLIGLTQRLTQQLAFEPNNMKKWVIAGSPESTLCGIGSWSASSNGSPNGELSPPTTPFDVKNDEWDVIYAAAGYVERLRMSNNEGVEKNNNYKWKGLLGPAYQNNEFCSSQNFGHTIAQMNQNQYQVRQKQARKCADSGRQQVQQQQQQHQIQRRGRCVPPPLLGLPQSAWPSLQVNQVKPKQTHHQRNQSSHHTSAKRECAGTGVFLPRIYTHSSDCKKKSACSKVLPVNFNLEDMNMKGHAQPGLNYALVSRRNAILTQQRGNIGQESVLNHEIELPGDWGY